MMLTISPYPFWIFMLVAGLCVLLIGIDKTGFGGAIGTLATPLLALVVAPQLAVGLLLPLFCACDLAALWHYRAICHKRNLWLMLPGGLAGIVAGALFIWLLRDQKAAMERTLRITIGLISILFVLYQAGRDWLLTHLPASRPGVWLGSLFGFTAGVTSTLAHAGGPPVTMYLLPQRLDRRIFVGTTVWFFAIVNYSKLIAYYMLGIIPARDNLKVCLLLLPLVPIGVFLGNLYNRKLKQEIFIRIILIVLLLTGCQLLSGKTIMDLLSCLGLIEHHS
jgi:uncharacterized membrane protein YfcA